VYYEDFHTVVEATTGRRLPERPARGHVESLSPGTRPTEYFADSVYSWLHSDPVKTWEYSLPDGRPHRHRYPPDRSAVAARDPRMNAALERFFARGARDAADLSVERDRM